MLTMEYPLHFFVLFTYIRHCKKEMVDFGEIPSQKLKLVLSRGIVQQMGHCKGGTS